MATYTGQIDHSQDEYLLPGYATGAVPPEPGLYDARAVSDDGHSVSGSLTKVKFQVNLDNHTGYLQEDYFEDFYFRILILPLSLDFGNVFGGKSATFQVWNGYLGPVTLSALVQNGVDDLILTDPNAPPTVYPGLEERTYGIQVTNEGVPTIDGSYSFVFSTETVIFSVKARRIVAWTFLPNWKSPVRERLSWLTDIIKSRDKTEQRRWLRGKPRRRVEYLTDCLTARESAYFQHLLYGWQNRLYAVPLPQHVHVLPAAANQGALSLNVDTTTRPYFDGCIAILIRSPLDFEVVEVDSVSAASISLNSPLSSTWPAGTYLFPANLGRLPTRVPLRRLTDSHIEANLQWEMDPVETNPALPVLSAGVTLDGVEVVLRKPNWASGLAFGAGNEFGLSDGQTGAVDQVPLAAYSDVSTRLHWLLKGRDEIWDFFGLLSRMTGRLNTAYFPTWCSDFQLLQDAPNGALTLTVQNNGYSRFILDTAMKPALIIFLKSGGAVARKITGASELDATREVISLGAVLDQDVNVSDVRMISQLHLCRLDSDEILLNYRTTSTAVVEPPIVSVTG